MGAPKQKWTSEEEEALRRGVLKHGAGKWRTIQKDPEFSPVLSSRSNIDLKDKWRNLSFSASGLGSRDKIRVPKITGPSSSSSPSSQALLFPTPNKVAEASPPVDAEKRPQDGKTPPKYGAMILEALSELNEPNGSEINAIYIFIEQRHEVQPNFRRLLSSKLRRLIESKKVEKVDKFYRLTDSFATKTPGPIKASTLKQKDPSKPSKASKNLGVFATVSPALEAAAAAAVKVADAEAKAHLAHEHMMEAERILKIAEETESLLTLAAEIYERCSSGEITTVNQVSQRDVNPYVFFSISLKSSPNPNKKILTHLCRWGFTTLTTSELRAHKEIPPLAFLSPASSPPLLPQIHQTLPPIRAQIAMAAPNSNDAPNSNASASASGAAGEEDTSIEALARRVQEHMTLASNPTARRHKFWETQPVGQFRDAVDASLPDGPIEPPTPLSEVRADTYPLPGAFEWLTCDLDDDAFLADLYSLLAHNYVEDDENMFRFNYSPAFLRWALKPPSFFRAWHIGVRAKESKKLVAFISGVPARIRAHDDVVRMAEINFLCVHKKLRSKRLAPVLIREVTRRVHQENIWQAAYTAGVVLPTPITTCRYWHRSLNPKKLIDVGFSRLGPRMTMSRTIRLYKLPDAPLTPGFRRMELRDVAAVTRLLKAYLARFVVAPDFDEVDVEHWLLPREDVVDSYLVESPETHEVTDFCSFYTLPSSVLNNANYATLKAAYSYYNVSTKTPLQQLMNDALIVAKQKNYDVFNALDVMENESFLKELKFGPGDGQLHYYLYNYRIRGGIKPSELGLVLL
ncbi:glycylpeptide N-tetradecanoyltransferase 1-like [Phragmites australis]|uniref:glycylpeptide N-tetradecanoyltransferase 1-like n=1 Tax=Phragmites australis TaxID=29695 RepID=UPI002D7745DA|nr:glycylpeptide N-tetradecanoyltransferase 1-like [Phragmites australis]